MYDARLNHLQELKSSVLIAATQKFSKYNCSGRRILSLNGSGIKEDNSFNFLDYIYDEKVLNLY